MGNSDTLTFLLLIILCIDGLLFLTQVSMDNINPLDSPQIYTYNGGVMQSYDGGNYTLNPDDYASQLPSAESSVNPETGNIFTDAFSSIKSWFSDSSVGRGISYVTQILGGPVNYLKVLGAPIEFMFVIGAIWYGMTMFALVMLLFGRT